MRSNRVVHFEIPANQPEALTKFYSEVFGWKFRRASFSGPSFMRLYAHFERCDPGAAPLDAADGSPNL